MNTLHRIACGTALAALVSGCAHAPMTTTIGTQTPLMQPLPGLFTAGQPAASDWVLIKADGIRTVINLRAAGELKDRNEAAEVKAAGLHYLEIPVPGGEGINLANARLLHVALAPRHGGGVLVHCASGNRAGALLALEQKDFDGASAQSALELGRKAGVTHIEPVLKKALGIGE